MCAVCRGAQGIFRPQMGGNTGDLSNCNKLPIHAMFVAQVPSLWNAALNSMAHWDGVANSSLGCAMPSLPPPSTPPSPPAPPSTPPSPLAPPPPPSTAGDDPTFIGSDGAAYHVCIAGENPRLKTHDINPLSSHTHKSPTRRIPAPLAKTCPLPLPYPPQVMGEPMKYYNVISAPTISLNAQVRSSWAVPHPHLSHSLSFPAPLHTLTPPQPPAPNPRHTRSFWP